MAEDAVRRALGLEEYWRKRAAEAELEVVRLRMGVGARVEHNEGVPEAACWCGGKARHRGRHRARAVTMPMLVRHGPHLS
jgi:hypothetical protein